MAHASGSTDVEDVDKELRTPHLLDSGFLPSEARKPGNGLPVGEHYALIDELSVGVIPVRQGDCVCVRQVDVYAATVAGQLDH